MSIFKSDQAVRREALEKTKQNLAARQQGFASEAKAAGFTEAQISLMVRYLSFQGHVHEYVNVGYRTTTPAGYYIEE